MWLKLPGIKENKWRKQIVKKLGSLSTLSVQNPFSLLWRKVPFLSTRIQDFSNGYEVEDLTQGSSRLPFQVLGTELVFS